MKKNIALLLAVLALAGIAALAVQANSVRRTNGTLLIEAPGLDGTKVTVCNAWLNVRKTVTVSGGRASAYVGEVGEQKLQVNIGREGGEYGKSFTVGDLPYPKPRIRISSVPSGWEISTAVGGRWQSAEKDSLLGGCYW